MSQPLVLFTDLTDLDPAPARDILGKNGFLTDVLRTENGRVIPEHQTAVGLIVGYRTLDEKILKQFPSLQIIATTSNGVDMVDTKYAERHNIWVTNVGHAATEEVAVHTLALILSAVRGLHHGSSVVAQGGWTAEFSQLPPRVSELTLGVIGFGRIGQKVASLATPFFGQILAVDEVENSRHEQVKMVDLTTLLRESDVITLHLPLTPATQQTIDAYAFSLMREGALLVNVSRGELIAEEALLQALHHGKVTTACLDVLDAEPPRRDHPLRTHPRVLMSPHVAFLSRTTRKMYEETAPNNIVTWWKTGKPHEWLIQGAAPQHVQ